MGILHWLLLEENPRPQCREVRRTQLIRWGTIDIHDGCRKSNLTTEPAHGRCDGEMASEEGLVGMVFPFSYRLRRLKRAVGYFPSKTAMRAPRIDSPKDLLKVIVPTYRRTRSALPSSLAEKKSSGGAHGEMEHRCTLRSCKIILHNRVLDCHKVYVNHRIDMRGRI